MLRRRPRGPSLWSMVEEQRIKWIAHVCTCKHHKDNIAALEMIEEQTPEDFFDDVGQLCVLDNGFLKLKIERWCPNDGCNYQLYFCKLAPYVDWKDPHEV